MMGFLARKENLIMDMERIQNTGDSEEYDNPEDISSESEQQNSYDAEEKPSPEKNDPDGGGAYDDSPAGNNSEKNEIPDEYLRRLTYVNFAPEDPDSEDFWETAPHSSGTAAAKKRTVFVIRLIVVILLMAAIFGYAIIMLHGKGWFSNLFSGGSNMEFTLPVADTPELEDKYYNDDGTYTAAGAAKALLPSVVRIDVYTENSLIATSQGSGIIFSDDGYIVTNAHVIKDADFGVTVTLYDETAYAAEIVGSDDSTDIAVLKIGASGLSPAQFGDSDECELGDEIITIGSPAGYSNSVTKGIISGLNRKIQAENSATAMDCIQIDAAINPGNSGGPLINMWGQVIGITSSKLVSTSYDNMGFAITINAAKPIIEELMEYGYIPDKPRVGITYYAISEAQAELYDTVAGLCVASIDEECNIAETELEVGDIITEMNGTAVSDTTAVSDIMSELKAGDEMTMTVYRPPAEDGTDGYYFEITFELNSDKTSMIAADEAEDNIDEDTGE